MKRVWLLLLIVLACLATRPVFATACSNPTTMAEGDILYNKDFHTYQFCNGTTWMAMGSPGASSGLNLISTQTASNSAALQFTNLPTSYNRLVLSCTGIITSAARATVELQFGEGAGPTWEAANYIYENHATGSTNYDQEFNYSSSASYIYLADGSTDSSHPTTLQYYINDIGNTSVYKSVVGLSTEWDTTPGHYSIYGGGSYSGDTNAITGLKLLPASGTITSGQCSLYGMN